MSEIKGIVGGNSNYFVNEYGDEKEMVKRVYLEYMRIIAIVLVIYNHLGGYVTYQYTGGLRQVFYMTLTMITRINVPLFLMISGALLLGKEENYKGVICRRLPRYLVTLLIFEVGLFILSLLRAIKNGEAYDISVYKFIQGYFSGDIDGAGSYWYIYAYIGFILMLPFLQRIVAKVENQDIIVLVMLHFIFLSVIPMVNLVFNANDLTGISRSTNLELPFITSKVMFYPILGYYFDKKINVDQINRRLWLLLIAALVLGIALSCLCTKYEWILTGAYTQNYVQLFDYLLTIVIFLLVKYIVTVAFVRLQEGILAKLVCNIGTLTFGIYLLDPFLKLLFGDKFITYANSICSEALIVSVCWILISISVGGVITFILKKLPGFRKLL